VLSVSEVALKVFEDPVLVKIICQNITSIFSDLLANSDSAINFERVILILNDLKYMAKPLVLPKIVSSTTFLDCLIRSLTIFQFADIYEMPSEMEPYPTFHKYFKLYTADARMIDHFKDYFQFITDKKDVQKIMSTF
jgi:hypothetical protein